MAHIAATTRTVIHIGLKVYVCQKTKLFHIPFKVKSQDHSPARYASDTRKFQSEGRVEERHETCQNVENLNTIMC